MIRRLLAFVLLLVPTLAFAQSRRTSDWVEYPDRGCIGGSTCAERRLRVALQDRPVIAVRFHAHDQVGSKAEGRLRVKIDGNTVRSNIDIPRAGETFNVDVDELLGRYLVFEPETNDEVEIRDIAVLYGRPSRTPGPPRSPKDLGPERGAWTSYPRASGCIGGSECRKNGTRITIALEDAPVIGVRFHAHDNIGQRAEGKVAVRIDSTTLGWNEDVQRNGKVHDVEVDNVRGSRLVIEAASDDEIEIRDVEVMYGRRGRGGRGGRGSGDRETEHEGGCIGGSECGGRRARIRIPLYGRAVNNVRFYARDDIGQRAGGVLRIRVDDTIIHHTLDIPREGRTFTIDGNAAAGDWLIIEPAEDDEVMIRDVRVTFEDEDD